MKKRIIALTLIVSLVAVMGLTGCGSSKPFSKYDLSDYVKVGNYKGLEVEKIKVSVSNEEVDAQVKKNVEETKTTEKKKEGSVAKNDVVNIDYEGKINGKTFDGGSAEGYDLTIGKGGFIDGFEDGLVGKAVGSTQTLNLKFPKDYPKKEDINKEVAGKAVVFTVKINYISKDVVPEYNDAWVAKNSDVKTTAEYEKTVKDQLYKEKENKAKSQKIGELWKEIVDNTEVIKYPEEEVDTYVKEIEEQYKSAAKSYGMELKDFWKQQGFESEEAYNADNKKTAQAYVKEQMVMYYIAEKEDLSYTKDDEKKLREAIEKAGYTEDTFKQYYGQDIDPYVEASLTFNAVGEFIYKNAKQVDKKTESTKKETKETTKATTKETKATDKSKETTKGGADNATSNDEPGGADA